MRICKIGEPTPPISKRFYLVDFIELSWLQKPDFSKEFIEKYEKGFSAKEIAIQYGCSKQKVLATLKRNNVSVRPAGPFTTSIANIYKGRRGRKPFYGFCYFEGEIIKHPVEFPVLLIIHKMWQEGRSAHNINLDLHRRKIKAREGGWWSWAAIRNILSRFESKNLIIHEGGKYEFR